MSIAELSTADARAWESALDSLEEGPGAQFGPLDLACALNPRMVRTPALELVSHELELAVTTSGHRLMISMPPQEGKALDISTPILTTVGWSTMGELSVGDQVFHPDGHPVRVMGAFAVMHGHRCYQVTTADGRSVVADAEHLWTVQDKRREVSRGSHRARIRSFEWKVLSTEQILTRGLLRDDGIRANGTPHRAYAFRLPPQHALISKPVDLPLDPYLLGAWLGDGTSLSAEITVGDCDIDEMVRLVSDTGARIVSKFRDRTAWRVRFNIGMPIRDGFDSRCRRLGIWGNKHIPDCYLTAGTEQRLALLQGLLDTDGSIFRTQHSSRVEFGSSRKILAEGVLFLVRSLGWRATIRESAATLNGREVGRRWRVCFTPERGGYEPFRLARKANRVQVAQSRGGALHAVSIVSIEPVVTRPVRCIRVDRPDGLFLAGRDLVATHNTSLIRHAVIRALQRNPDKRNVIASHALDLARTSGRAIRQMIDMFGTDAIDPATRLPLPDRLGIAVAADHAAAADWELRGHSGGLYCVGVSGSLTGRPIDGVLYVDDPVKGLAEANSTVFQSRSQDWWQAVSETRLAPEASVVIVMTRWSELDLVGWLLGSDTADEWRVINIPALADGVTDDALNRPIGGWMESARGRTVEHWGKIRKRVGERVFGSLYQGRPAPLEGGIFKREWFDRDRVRSRPEGPRPPVIVVDPADNTGAGDETGIGVASVDDHSRIYIGPDYSGHYTAARWARLALLACVRHEAAALAYERSLSGVRKIVQDAWSSLWKQARALRRHHPGDWPAGVPDKTIMAVTAELVHVDDPPDTIDEVRSQLVEMWPQVPGLLGYPSTGPRVQIVTPKTSKKLRAEAVMSLYENRRVSHVGDMRIAEFQMATWNAGQASPDRMDWVVYALALLDGTQGVMMGRSTERLPTNSTSLRNGGTSRIVRSTRR